MRRVIFYSWQSDLPNAANRGFIQKALEDAAAAIVADNSIAIEPVVDRDTQGVAGAPDIAATIFAKIAASDLVVVDVSIVSRSRKGRATPNPNVLVEFGYAMRAVGPERLILVFNKEFGKIEELPFDLRMRRLVTYEMPENAQERSGARGDLARILEAAIRAALIHVEPPTAVPLPAVAAVEQRQPNRLLVVRRSLNDLLKRLRSLEPKKARDGGTAQELLDALDQTQEVVAEFSKLCEVVAAMDDYDAALEIYRWMGSIVEQYELPRGFSGTSTNADFDYFKFLGHELFVTLIAFLLREQRWTIISRLLEEPIPVKYIPREGGPGEVSWEEISEHLPLLIDESTRRRRVSLHGDALHARHTSGGLSAILPFDDFAAADFLLFLRVELPPGQWSGGSMAWRPWSVLYVKRCPAFIQSARRREAAEKLAGVFKVPSIAELQKRLAERAPHVNKLFRDIWGVDFRDTNFKDIGTA